MANPEMDYSGIVEAPATQKSTWRAPRHVFFGKKDADGVMEDEPKYEYKALPAHFYKMVEGRIIVKVIQSEDELKAAKDDGWKDTPAAFGYIGAPSFEESLKLKAAAEAAEMEVVASEVAAEKRGPGRPKKAETAL